ncbi:MAG: ESX secretion-associated protein EspG [Pseudonocardiaceae bacterium]
MTRDITLTLEQYDICWADLGLDEQVYPLRIRGHGRTHEERAHLRRRVYQQLGARELARGERLEPELAGALTLLARAPVWVDMQWLSAPRQAEPDRAVAARYTERGLIARLDGMSLRLMPCTGTSLLPALIGQLPAASAAPGQSISLPREILMPAAPRVATSVYDTSPATSGRCGQQYRALAAVLAKPRLRGGQIVANGRDRTGKRHRSRPVEWFDTEAGRWSARTLPALDGGEHLTVCPADSARLATQVNELLNRMTR